MCGRDGWICSNHRWTPADGKLGDPDQLVPLIDDLPRSFHARDHSSHALGCRGSLYSRPILKAAGAFRLFSGAPGPKSPRHPVPPRPVERQTAQALASELTSWKQPGDSYNPVNPFGQIKQARGFRQFLTARYRESIRAERAHRSAWPITAQSSQRHSSRGLCYAPLRELPARADPLRAPETSSTIMKASSRSRGRSGAICVPMYLPEVEREARIRFRAVMMPSIACPFPASCRSSSQPEPRSSQGAT